ncbi:hypothetical protein ZIOFF_046620 [Zingiber officinale]|uniref:Uncharacterized protein n=1 Tax=Zingiber officinale TaxID=94328 RepID=A0A8J5FPL4_ZINOF|nr:hypothetical protein ZIOFF_046620 [Zingiber officinale]
MGNKIGKKRQVVDEKYTRLQGLYQHIDIDHKRLRKLILDSKLAAFYPGLDDHSLNLEECPMCFLYYPSLNRSRCCVKGMCTVFSSDETIAFHSPNTLSPSGGLAGAAAALAEHQHMNGDSSSHMDLHVKDAAAVHLENRREMPPEESGVSSTEHWLLVAEGTSYAGSDGTIEAGTSSEGMNMASGRIVPEIFEEQMMLAMAVTC